MKKQQIFPGVLFVGVACYLFLNETNNDFLTSFYHWSSLMIIIGIAFLLQAYVGKEYEAILPGVLMFGIGLHFHVIHQLNIQQWPGHIEIFMLIFAAGFLLRYLKLKKGLFEGCLFLVIALIMLFDQPIIQTFPVLQTSIEFIWRFWPFIFLALGGFFLFYKRR